MEDQMPTQPINSISPTHAWGQIANPIIPDVVPKRQWRVAPTQHSNLKIERQVHQPLRFGALVAVLQQRWLGADLIQRRNNPRDKHVAADHASPPDLALATQYRSPRVDRAIVSNLLTPFLPVK